MKFKVGDKVILGQPSFDLVDAMNHEFGKEDTILSSEDTPYGLFYRMNISSWRWHESGVTSIESQEYFYVGQTVYSPIFKNKERKAVITRIDKSLDYPILCEGEDDVWMTFTLYGKHKNDEDYVSLFQEPIQFTINKPIETFEKGEIVEVSDDGENWVLGYYVLNSMEYLLDSNKPHIVSLLKDKEGELLNRDRYAKIRKVK